MPAARTRQRRKECLEDHSTMKLYITDGSPYARIARIVIIEKQLESRVELVSAQTRRAGSPYYGINPSGRVPYLVRDDGVGMEESAVICAYLDHLDGQPRLGPPAGDLHWEALRLEARARSMIDGLAVWIRELRRPENERSPTIIQHEADRSLRRADFWEQEIDHPWMRGALNMAQITLGCALGLEARYPEFRWRPGRPKLVAWFDAFAKRPSYIRTQPASQH
jgi:glutathione S-transferase